MANVSGGGAESAFETPVDFAVTTTSFPALPRRTHRHCAPSSATCKYKFQHFMLQQENRMKNK